MNSFDDATKRAVFEKCNRKCHLCGNPIAFSNYGIHGSRGAWEVDHSIPLSQGGTHHLNNLYAAHTSCNRSKQARSSRSVRQDHGLNRAPISAEAMKDLKAGDAWVGAFSIGMLGARIFGPPGLLIGAIVGAIGAYAVKRAA